MNSFPRIDIKDYPSPTTPLYFIFLAAIGKLLNCKLMCFRIINLMVGITFILFLFYYISKRSNNINAFLFSLCFAFSPYVFGPSIRIATDNFSLLFVLTALYYFDSLDRIEIKRFSKATISSFLSIMTRQISVWLCGLGIFRAIKYEPDIKLKITKILLSLIPLIMLGFILNIWKGLVPQRLQQQHQTTGLFNSSVIFYIISVIGFYGIFFFCWIYESIKKNRIKISDLTIIIISAFIFLSFYRLSPESIDGNWGGVLWRISMKTPEFLSVSLPFWIFFPLGSIIIYTIVRNEINEKNFFISVVLALWIIANLPSRPVFERYYQPFILFILGYSFLDSENKPRYYWYGPLVLLGMFLGADVIRYLI